MRAVLILVLVTCVLMLGSPPMMTIAEDITASGHMEAGEFELMHWYYSDNQPPWINGLVGPTPNSRGDNTATAGSPTAADQQVWAKFGHQVSGSECPTSVHDKTDPDPFAAQMNCRYDTCSTWLLLKFRRADNDGLPYRVEKEDVTLDDKRTASGSTDIHCPDVSGPPTWSARPWVKVSLPRILWHKADGSTEQDWPGDEDDGGSFTPPAVDHRPEGVSTRSQGSKVSFSIEFNPTGTGPWIHIPGSPVANPGSYEPSSSGDVSGQHGERRWYPPSEDPGNNDKYRSDVMDVGVKVKTNFDASAEEIRVSNDSLNVRVMLTVRLNCLI